MSEDAGQYKAGKHGQDARATERAPVFSIELFVNAHGGVEVKMRADDKLLAEHPGAAAVAAVLSETIAKFAGPAGPTKDFVNGAPAELKEGGQ